MTPHVQVRDILCLHRVQWQICKLCIKERRKLLGGGGSRPGDMGVRTAHRAG